MAKYGLDLSTYQRNVNYMSLKASNIDFAIIRSGFGKHESQKDNLFEEHYAGFKAINIPIGVFHYSYLTSLESAIEEAKVCLKFIGDKQIELPVFIDIEEERSRKLGKKLLTECIIAFCTEIEKAGFKAGVYANLNYFKNYIDVNLLIEKGYKIWLAQWANKMTAKFKVDYWQYTSKGQIHGIQGIVDLDVCMEENNSQPVDNSVEKPKFEIGKTYKTQVDLHVRTAPRNI